MVDKRIEKWVEGERPLCQVPRTDRMMKMKNASGGQWGM